MLSIRYRIAALAGGSVLVTLLLIMGAFNVIIRRQMHDNAKTALESVLDPTGMTERSVSPYSPEVLFVQDGTQENTYYSRKEQTMIACCDAHEPSAMQKAEIDGNVCYILMSKDSTLLNTACVTGSVSVTQEDGSSNSYSYIYSTDVTSPVREIIAYVDITGEMNMIRQIDLVFLIAALLIGSLSVTTGYLTGKKLEQNQLAQKQFFENTSHELKTPLTSIRGYAEGIETGVITDYQKTGRVIAAQTEKMSRLIEEILCMAKLESGSGTLEKESVDFPAFLQDCMMPFEGTVLTRGLSVQLDLHPLTIAADPEKLEHALSNPLTNALKYARTDIRITCDSGHLRIENDCEPLTDDVLRHLFDRFYTGRGGNTGIGLSIAKDLIELHGWKLNAVRTETGIAFVVRIPE